MQPFSKEKYEVVEKDQELQQVVKLKLEDSPFHKFCKVVIYKSIFCWLLFHAKIDCNYTQASEARRLLAGVLRLSFP